MLPIPGLDPGSVDPSEAAFASGMLAGAGLREISQTLGLSRKRGAGAKDDGSMPSSATMVQGNMGELDKIMLLARLKESMAGMSGMPGAMPADPMAALAAPPGMPPGGPAGPMPPAGPLPPGLPPAMPPGGPMPLPGGMPPLHPGALAPPIEPPPPQSHGGTLPLQMLMKLLGGASGMV